MTIDMPVRTREGWLATGDRALRELAAVSAAGAVLGLAVGGIGGRAAMRVLARLNPDATGITSDDGFTMGQLTSATLNLLAVATVIGALGGGIYYLVRGLMVGPRWFQVLSISLGPAVVVGSMLVHVEGVDFTLLEPAWLGIAMFVAIPAVYAALLTLLAERWLAPGSRFRSAPLWVALVPILLWGPAVPVLAILVLVLVAGEVARRTTPGRTLLTHPAWPWLVRGALGALFVVALVDLVRDVTALV